MNNKVVLLVKKKKFSSNACHYTKNMKTFTVLWYLWLNLPKIWHMAGFSLRLSPYALSSKNWTPNIVTRKILFPFLQVVMSFTAVAPKAVER